MLSDFFTGAIHQTARRGRQISAILASEGGRGLKNRLRRFAFEKLRPKSVVWEVFPEDVIAADLTSGIASSPRPLRDKEPISVNWIATPAAPGSGGHTTLFRMVNYLERNGFRNTVYLYDVYKGDHQYYTDILRSAYGVTCAIRSYKDGLDNAHAVVASSWPTAYAAYNSKSDGARFYFVQDYEPSFYPASTNNLLAENTYRMGFHGITAGRWLSEKLAADFGMECHHFDFGCDTSRYQRTNDGPRNGIAFYSRSTTPRRGVELCLLALEIFAQRNPGIELHFYGDEIAEMPFKFVNHGTVSPARLNEIYNQSFAGLNLSLTNVSLVPHEMLAAGCIPVVNEARHNRIVLNNDHVCYAEPTPHALAQALEQIVRNPEFQSVSRAASESVSSVSWDAAGAAVANAISEVVRLRAPRSA
ncbi:MAG: glycosyltransferase family 1 protein [Rhizobiaceae bacterium]|nr:glycosyltransferase family 1 protein [Rhizobiaceae bacterium]